MSACAVVLLIGSSSVFGSAGAAVTTHRAMIREQPPLVSAEITPEGAVLSSVTDSHSTSKGALAVNASGAASVLGAVAPTVECAKPHDFVIGIDASNSIGVKNWPLEVGFANSVISELLGMGVGHRVATYYFAKEATKVSDFSDDAAALQSALNALSYDGPEGVKFGQTNHPAGFFLSEELFGGSPLADSKKLHLLITDGAPWKSCQHLTDAQVAALPCTPACQNKEGTCDYLNKKGKPSGAYCKCAVHTADAFNSKYATYTVGVLNKKGRTDAKKLMAMATSSDFYLTADFEELPSVIKDVTLGVCQDPSTTATTTTTTTTTTEAPVCDAAGPDQHLRLDRATVIQNNLDGEGPSSSGPEVIRYSDVATLADGTVVDLVVSSDGGYTPFEGQVIRNGLSQDGPVGIIGMEASLDGNTVDLDFSFVSSSSGLPVEMATIDFSILDADTGLTSAQESVTVSGFDSFYVSKETEIQVSTAPDGRATFTATQSGHRQDNAKDPLHLTERQAKRSVNFVFTTVSKISMTLAVSNSAWVYGRDFLFSGKSAVKDCGVLGEWTAPAGIKEVAKKPSRAEKKAAREAKRAARQAARAERKAKRAAKKAARKARKSERKSARKSERKAKRAAKRAAKRR